MGSGSLAAMAVFESQWKGGLNVCSISSNMRSLKHLKFTWLTQREEAVALVSAAISAGIFNDLGSGSNVDVCVITASGTEMLRNYKTDNVRATKENTYVCLILALCNSPSQYLTLDTNSLEGPLHGSMRISGHWSSMRWSGLWELMLWIRHERFAEVHKNINCNVFCQAGLATPNQISQSFDLNQNADSVDDGCICTAFDPDGFFCPTARLYTFGMQSQYIVLD